MTSVVNLRDFRRPGSQSIDLPPDVVRIDRRSRWGNPYRIGDQHPGVSFTAPMTREGALMLYRGWLAARLRLEPGYLEPLRGKRLACWCSPLPCHGDVIVELLG